MSFQSHAETFLVAGSPPARAQVCRPIGGSRLFWRGKRVFDLGLSLLLLPILLGLMALLAGLNPLINPGPLFFRQIRMGRHCTPFTAVKFRTMRPAAGGRVRAWDEPLETHRITRIGSFLRQTRIDELPQLFNVLRGDMSLIGPRPDSYDHAMACLRAIPDYRDRHAVRPGISGLAQVTIGYAVGLEATRAKAAADLAYLRHAGPLLEARIFWRTLVTIARRGGI